MTHDTVDVTTARETTRFGVDRVVVRTHGTAWNESERRRMIPRQIPRDELFFWTAAWQAGEHESAQQRAAGNLRHFANAEDLLDWLRAPEDS